MSHVNYNSKRLIPAPLVEFTKTYQTTDDGTKIGSLWNIGINGKAMSFKGSPDSSGTFWTLGGFPPDESIDEDSRLASILRKQEAIRTLFSNDGYSLEWQSENGNAPIKCNPRIKEINFVRDIWFNFVEYNINAEADVLYINGLPYGEDTFSGYVESASESWQIETDDSQPQSDSVFRTYRLTHSLSAKGKRFFDSNAALVKEAWQQAKDWVVSKAGFDSSIITNSQVKDLNSSSVGYNYIRSENIDEFGGSYSLTENWVLATDSAFETFDISVRTSADTGLTSVGIDGTITGLETRNPTTMALVTSKYDAASSKYVYASGQALSRAQLYSDTTLNTIPLSTTTSKNPNTGVITYSYEYNNRASNIIPNAKTEVISINDSLATDVVAIVPVLGRTKGPVLQAMGTSKELRRTLDVEVVMTPITYGAGSYLNSQNPRVAAATSAAIQSIVDAYNPTNALSATKCFLDDNTERWEPKEGRYSMTKTWIYEQ